MRTLVASLFLVLTPCCLCAQTLSVERVNIIHPGIYEVEITKESDEKNLTGHSWNVVRKIRNVKNTTSIPARICVTFGFEYVIVGAPIAAEIPIKMIVKFPSRGLHNPETRETTYRIEALVGRTIGRRHFRSYTLDKQWELVPGVWTFELWHKDRKLAEQRFTLSQPCAGCDQAEPPTGRCEERLVSDAPITPSDDPRWATGAVFLPRTYF